MRNMERESWIKERESRNVKFFCRHEMRGRISRRKTKTMGETKNKKTLPKHPDMNFMHPIGTRECLMDYIYLYLYLLPCYPSLLPHVPSLYPHDQFLLPRSAREMGIGQCPSLLPHDPHDPHDPFPSSLQPISPISLPISLSPRSISIYPSSLPMDPSS